MPRRGPGETQLVSALRGGDDEAFAALVDAHHASMVQVAAAYVRGRSIAEEVAQETWLIVLQRLDRFEGRASLKTWIFSILINRAKTRGAREQRQLSFATLADPDEPSVPANRFRAPDHPQARGQWSLPPQPWPEERLLMRETIDVVREAIAMLPLNQQVVLGLRDVEGWTAEEVSDALEITSGNQRVILHRARARVRSELEAYFQER